MRNLLILCVLLLGAFWAAAQDSSQTSAQTSQATASQTTVQGCLSDSGGNYTLTQKNGTTFQLTGDAALLSKHVGHEVKITGTEGSNSASSSSETGGGMGQSAQRTIEVSSLKHISKTCQSGAAH